MTANQIVKFYRNLKEENKKWREVENLKRQIAHHLSGRKPKQLDFEHFRKIVDWKLQGQKKRNARHYKSLNDDIIGLVTACAFSLEHEEPGVAAEMKIRVLSALPGVHTAVASAILAMCDPDRFGVIDFRAWGMLHPRSKRHKSTFSIREYREYLSQIRQLAEKSGETPQKVDFALWATHKELSNRRA